MMSDLSIFGSSIESLILPLEEIEMIPDVELYNVRDVHFLRWNRKISADFAQKKKVFHPYIVRLLDQI